MARRPDSEAIARGPCITKGCDKTILVFKTKRRGHYLMGRCPDCKTIDGTGKAVQEGLQAIVDGTATEPTPTKETPPEPAMTPAETLEDYDPGESLPDPETKPTKKAGGGVGLFMLFIAVVGGVILKS